MPSTSAKYKSLVKVQELRIQVEYTSSQLWSAEVRFNTGLEQVHNNHCSTQGIKVQEHVKVQFSKEGKVHLTQIVITTQVNRGGISYKCKYSASRGITDSSEEHK